MVQSIIFFGGSCQAQSEKVLVMLAYSVAYRSWVRLSWIRVALVVWAILAWIPGISAPAEVSGATIVIDPGHGGMDTGARGAEGTLEKEVTLAIAQVIAAALEPDHRGLITRTGDYGMDTLSRTAVANQAKADLFISIHTGGSFLRQAGGIHVFYFKELSEADAAPGSPGGETQKWDTVQYRHQAESGEFAKLLAKQLDTGEFFKVKAIEGAPLTVLRGADMPAVLIEIGYLTHPLEEKKLKDKRFLSDLAERFKNAISAFLEKKAGRQ